MAKQPRSLHGQVAAITGAARGIGRATAGRARSAKARRWRSATWTSRSPEQTAGELGAGTVAFELDVTDRSSFERFLDQTEDALGPLDVLVNNAGIMPLSRFVDEDDATAIRQIDINLHGVIYGTKSALRRMERRGRGHIVNIASSAGKSGVPGGADLLGDQARRGRAERGDPRRAPGRGLGDRDLGASCRCWSTPSSPRA